MKVREFTSSILAGPETETRGVRGQRCGPGGRRAGSGWHMPSPPPSTRGRASFPRSPGPQDPRTEQVESALTPPGSQSSWCQPHKACSETLPFRLTHIHKFRRGCVVYSSKAHIKRSVKSCNTSKLSLEENCSDTDSPCPRPQPASEASGLGVSDRVGAGRARRRLLVGKSRHL